MKEIKCSKETEEIMNDDADDLMLEEARAISHLGLIDDMDSSEYRAAVQNVKDISAARTSESRQFVDFKKLELETKKLELEEKRLDVEIRKLNSAKEIDPNTLIASGASLAAIALILNYERLHALTSKGVSVALRMLPRAI